MLNGLRASLENEQVSELQLAGFRQQHAADVLDVLLAAHQSGKKLPVSIVHAMTTDAIDDPRITTIPEKHRAAGFDACMSWIYKVSRVVGEF